MMNKRYTIAGILITVGVLLIFGAAGDADFSGGFEREFIRRSVLGLILIFAAVPVSGDLDIDVPEEKKNRP